MQAEHVLCLIACPERVPLDPAVVEAIARELAVAPHWLADEEACELPVASAAGKRALELAGEALGEAPVDVALVPARGRRKRLLVTDMDSTVITVECIDELADLVGIKAEVASITRRAMNGELDFKAALEARVALLAGLPASVLEEVYRDRIRLMPGAHTLVRTMRQHGALTALVSGGFVPIVERVAAEVGFATFQANALQVQDGRLTGKLDDPVHGGDGKLAFLEALAAREGIGLDGAVAIGDGANDLPMIHAAGLGIAYRAHPRVAQATAVSIRHGNLTAALYLQGIPKRAFAAA